MPSTPTTGVGSMSPPTALVVEADVPADDREAERPAGLGHPVDRLRELPHHLGVLGVAEVQAVHERERPGPDAGQVEHRLGHHRGRAGPRVDRAPAVVAVGGERQARPVSTPVTGCLRRRTVASPPGPSTVLRNSWWSYCDDTQDVSASSAEQVGGRRRPGRARRGAPGSSARRAARSAGAARGRSYSGASSCERARRHVGRTSAPASGEAQRPAAARWR